MPHRQTATTPAHPPAPVLRYGRGGAGNIVGATPATSHPPAKSAGSTATTESGYLPPKTYLTGRGGAGNATSFSGRAMFKFDEELHGTASGAAPVYHIGRGGAGNAVHESRAESGSHHGVMGRLRDSFSSRRSTASSIAS